MRSSGGGSASASATVRRRRHAGRLRSTCAVERLRVRVRVRARPARACALRRHLHGPTQIIQNSGNLSISFSYYRLVGRGFVPDPSRQRLTIYPLHKPLNDFHSIGQIV